MKNSANYFAACGLVALCFTQLGCSEKSPSVEQFVLPVQHALSASELNAEVAIYTSQSSPEIEGSIAGVPLDENAQGQLIAELNLTATPGDKLLRVYLSHDETGALLWVGEWLVVVEPSESTVPGAPVQTATSGDGSQFIGDAHPTITGSDEPFGPDDEPNIEQICTPGTGRCDGALLESCNPNGFGFVAPEACETDVLDATAECDDGECVVACESGYHTDHEDEPTACVSDYDTDSCGPDRIDCTDEISCTLEACRNDNGEFRCATLEESLGNTNCLIDGDQCIAAGDTQSGNPCMECQPVTDPFDFSPDDSNAYDDDDVCTLNDFCEDGQPESSQEMFAVLELGEDSPFDLGQATTGSTVEAMVTLMNLEEQPARGLSIIEPGDPFHLPSHTCGDILGAGESCVIQLAFTPIQEGQGLSELRVEYNNCRTIESTSIQIAGTGLGPPDPNGVPDGFELIEVAAFTMGSPSTEAGRDEDEEQHEVTITRDFFMQAHEVTQDEWRSLMETTPSRGHPIDCDTCPVDNVSWYDALEYANRKSDSEGLSSCYELNCENEPNSGESHCDQDVEFEGVACPGYRLPTEAEWEYAARARTETAFHGGSSEVSSGCTSEGAMELIGWYCFNSEQFTHPVGDRSPNAFGLYDMSGNVAEWTWDWYGVPPANAEAFPPDPLGALSGAGRVIRGGSWFSTPGECRSAARALEPPNTRNGMLGFRLVRSAQP